MLQNTAAFLCSEAETKMHYTCIVVMGGENLNFRQEKERGIFSSILISHLGPLIVIFKEKILMIATSL